jgi:hypothetical protein
LSGLTFGAGRWLAVGYYGTILGSGTGDNWEGLPTVHPDELEGVAAGPHGFVTVGRDGLWAGTPDAREWRRLDIPTNHRLRAVQYDGETMVAVGDNGTVLRSSDGRVWAQVDAGISRSLFCLATDGRSWVAAGEWGHVYRSDDGLTWQECQSVSTQDLYAVTDGAAGWVATGRNGTLLYSRDGRSWRRAESGVSRHLYAVASEGSLYVAVGEGGAVARSEDGRHWEAIHLGRRNHLEGISAVNGQWWAVGYEGILFTSLDGRTWVQMDSPTETGLYEIASDSRRMVAVGEGGAILTRAAPPPPVNVGAVVSADPRLGRLRLLPAGTAPVPRALHPGSEKPAEFPTSRVLLPGDIAVMERPVAGDPRGDFPALRGSVIRAGQESSAAKAISPLTLTWREAVLFANRLSRARGLPSCYYTSAEHVEPVSRHNFLSADIVCDFTSDGFRLPSERDMARLAAVRAGSLRGILAMPAEHGEWCWPAGDMTLVPHGQANGASSNIRVVARDGTGELRFMSPPPGGTRQFRLVRTIPRSGPCLQINRLSFGPSGEADIVFSAYQSTGQPLEGLRQEDLRVALDGQEVPFNLEGLPGAPFVAGVICLDKSASIPAATVDSGRRLVADLLRLAGPDDRWAVVTAGDSQPLSGLTKTHDELLTEQDREPTGGFTRLYDALIRALDILGPSRGSRHVVVLTDGRDTHSRHTLHQAMEVAMARRICLHVIGMEDSPGEALPVAVRETGGRLFRSPAEVSPAELMAGLRRYPAGQYRVRGLAADRLKSATELRLSVFHREGLGEASRTLPGGLALRAPLAVKLPDRLEIPPSGRVAFPVTLDMPLDNLPDAWKITTWEFELEYDPHLIRVEDLWPSGTLCDGWNVRGEKAQGRMVVRAEGPRPLGDRGRLLNINLTPAPGAGPGDGGLIRLSGLRMNGEVMDGVTAETMVILGEHCVAGDVSGDGAVSVFDAQLIEQYVLGESGDQALPLCAADVTADGHITALDAAWIRHCDAGEWSEFPAMPGQAAASPARLRLAVEDMYQEREFVWRVPVILDSRVETVAWEMVFMADENDSLGFEPSALTDTCSMSVARRGNTWRVVLTGTTPLRNGCLLYVEIRTDPPPGLSADTGTPPSLIRLLRAYRIDEYPPFE